MRIGVLLPREETFSAYYGGAVARWVSEVYRRLDSPIDVTVFGAPVTPEDIYQLPYCANSSSRVCGAISRIPYVRRYGDRVWLKSWRAQLRSCDLLHIHCRPQWVPLLRAAGFRGSLVLHLHNNSLGHCDGPGLDRIAMDVQAVVVCSRWLQDTFVQKSPAIAAKTQVVYNGVDTELFYPSESIREPKTVFIVGRFDPEKGMLQLVRAYDRVLESHPDAKLVIGGTTGFGTHNETNYVREVRRTANAICERHDATVQFLGYIHHDRDLPSWFQRATLFACPSIFQEPFGLVNAEAMACATPIVGSDRGGIPEVVADGGVFVNPDDIEALAQAISMLFSHPDHRRSLGRSGYERCKRLFDWDAIAGKWQSLLETLSS